MGNSGGRTKDEDIVGISIALDGGPPSATLEDRFFRCLAEWSASSLAPPASAASRLQTPLCSGHNACVEPLCDALPTRTPLNTALPQRHGTGLADGNPD